MIKNFANSVAIIATLTLFVSTAFVAAAEPSGTIGEDGSVTGNYYLNARKDGESLGRETQDTVRLSKIGGVEAALTGKKATVQDLYMNGGSLGQPYSGQENYSDNDGSAYKIFSENVITNLYYSATLDSYDTRTLGTDNKITNFIFSNSGENESSYDLAADSLKTGSTEIKSDSFATITNFAINNSEAGTLGGVTQSGGTLTNSGIIGSLTYNGGILLGSGSVNNLTVNNNNSDEFFASNFTVGTIEIGNANFDKSSFASVENLTFDADGSGYLKISGFVDNDNSLGFDFADSVTRGVDLSNGRLVVDISGALGDDVTAGNTDEENWANVTSFLDTYGLTNLNLSSLFGTSTELTDWESIDYLKVLWGEEEGQSFNIIGGGEFVSLGYGWAESGAIIVWNDPTPKTDAAAPEPATMLILGLGIAGLAVTRRRKK